MLIQITNQCDNNCPHCLHNSVINGGHMSLETFDKALLFAKEMQVGVIVISGGEPFMHPHIYELCKRITKPFMICSNGNFIKNPFLKRVAISISHLSNYMGLQVTSTKELYPNYWDIRKRLREFDDIPGVRLCMDINIYIKNLGRAENYPVNKTYPAPSCMNGHLVFKQTKTFAEAGEEFNKKGIFCHPLVDWQGNIHLSESWLCPSIGNVNTPYDILLQKLHDTPPCKKCKNWKVFEQMNKFKKVIELVQNK